MVVGLPRLAEALALRPGLAVRSAPPRTPLRSALNEVVGADNPFATVIVAAEVSDPNMEETALALVRGGYRLVVVNGGAGDRPVCHPEIPSLTAPFAPEDVIAVIEGLAGPAPGSPAAVASAAPFDLEWAVPRPGVRSPADPAPGALSPPAPPAPDPGGPDSWGEKPAGLCGEEVQWRAFSPHSSSAASARRSQPGDPWATDERWPGPDEGRIRPSSPGRPKVLVFACPKGGSGKTSLSLTYASFLGAALRPAHRSVIWVDGNLQQADGARYLGADDRSSRSILDLVGQPELDEHSVLEAVTPPEGTGRPISALFGPTFKSDADPRVITADLYRQTVGVLRRHFDYVIVDTPVAEHHDRFFREFALPEADQLVVVVPPLLPVVRGVREWLDLQSHPVAAGGCAFPPAKVRLVLNMASERTGCPVEMVRDAWLTRWSWAGEIPYDPAWTAATNNGTLLAERPGLAEQFANLVRLTTGDIIEVRGGRDRRRRRRLVGLLRDAFLR
jgi:MinD-like ATPase involved in chromosome partitioning or flagellar assembly